MTRNSISTLAWAATAIVIASFLGGVWLNWSGAVLGPFGGIDPHLQMGLMEWNARHWTDAAAWYDLPIFYPEEGALGFMDTLLGQTWLVTPIRWLFQPAGTSLYNTAFLGSLLLAALAMCLFWRASGGEWWSGGVAALGLIATPYTLSQLGHLNQLPPPFVLFGLAALVAALRRQEQPRARAVFWWLLGACLAMQAAWGWQGFAYAVLAVAVFKITWLVYWIRLRRPTREMLLPTILHALLPALLTAAAVGWLAQPQLRAADRHDEFTRTQEEVRTGSADLQHILHRGAYAAGGDDWIGRGLSDPLRFREQPRQAMSPAWIPLLLAAIGWWYRGYLTRDQRRTGRALFILGVLGLVLAFGDSVGIPFTDRRLPLPFSFLREIAPPFKAFRTVWRFSWLATVAVAWWSAVGAEQILARYGKRRSAWIGVAAALALTALFGLPAGVPVVPVEFDLRTPESAALSGPVLSLPAPELEVLEDRAEGIWLLRALELGVPVTGGATGWVPPRIAELRRRLADCESGAADPAALLREMRQAGVVAAEIVHRPGDERRTEFWKKALNEFGAAPIDAAPRRGYHTYRLP